MILASREHLSPTLAPTIRECVSRCTDIDYFVLQCLINKTYPLILHNLNELPGDESPFLHEACIEIRKHVVQRWIPFQLRLERTIGQIRTSLRQAEVPFAFMRGLPLASRFYTHPELRATEDIDLLVHESDRERCEEVLLELGFVFREHTEKRACRASYMGQAEFHHLGRGICLDLNWRLTGNASIGDVCLDMPQTWSRAKPNEDGEYFLSPEDTLVDLVRHSCHGHNFGTGLLKTCVDVAAVLRCCDEDIEWDYVGYQTRKGEVLRGFAFFGWFYNHCYRQSEEELLFNIPECSRSCAASTDCRLFASTIYWSELRLRPMKREMLREVILENLGIIAKLWALDSARRFLSLLKIAVWPTRTELTLLVGRDSTNSPVRMRLKHWLFSILAVPAIVWGVAMRCLAFMTFRMCHPEPPGNAERSVLH